VTYYYHFSNIKAVIVARGHLRWIYPILGFVACGLVFLSLSRLALTLWQLERVTEVDGFWWVLLQGVRFDVVLLAQLVVIPVLIIPLISIHQRGFNLIMPLLRYYFVLIAGLLIFIEFITPNFIGQYDFRPNILLIEYLAYPQEVMSMLLKAVPIQLFLAITATALLLWKFSKFLCFLEQKTAPTYSSSAPLLAILGVLLCVGGARSTLGHRPVNPSTVVFSPDSLVNTLPLSSAYSVVYALYEKIKHEQGGKPIYGEMHTETVLGSIYQGMLLPESDFFDSHVTTLHTQRSELVSPPHGKKNLVIILQESLGADFVGKLGGQNLTPNIDKLAEQGIWFDNLYATGTRSVRGIEAVITGFLPTPARSVVKLGGSQNNFFTIGQLLAQQGYDTSFIYGGEAHFDNMKRFFSNNGFNKIIEQQDYVDPQFTGSWGVSDEDLLNKAHQTFSDLSTTQQPFFSLVFTSTNHSPFEFPDGRIELAEQPKNTVANAVKYADFALGQFIEKAKQSDYWQDTVFLIIADHSDRVYGNELVPIDKFHIPGLVLGGSIQPQTITQVASQIDMLPTMLSLMGVETNHPAIGRDLTRAECAQSEGRAMMQFGNNFAYMQDDRVVILQKEREPLGFVYSNKQLIPSGLDSDLAHKALAHSVWPVQAYGNKAYRLP
jgi:phosphoglycerol transferase MdoB-like AlkP superfamily enzyme